MLAAGRSLDSIQSANDSLFSVAMSLRLISVCVCFFLSFTVNSISRADFVLNISDGVSFAPEFVSVDPGDNVTIDFLLTQTNGETSLDSTLSGLFQQTLM